MLEAHPFRRETSRCGLFFSAAPSESEQKWDVNGPQCSEGRKNSSLVLAFPPTSQTHHWIGQRVSLKRGLYSDTNGSPALSGMCSPPLPSPFPFQIPYFLEFNGLTGTGMWGRLRSGKKKLLPWSEGWGNRESLREAGTHCLFMFFEGGLPFPSSSSPQSPSIQPWGENGGGLWDCQGSDCVAEVGQAGLGDWQILQTHRQPC